MIIDLTSVSKYLCLINNTISGQMMKSTVLILGFFFFGIAKTQITKNFSKELDVLIKADITKIKGKLISSQISADNYESMLKLSGFALSYSETSLGKVLCGSYLSNGNHEIMNQIYEKLNQIPYLIFDSKTHPEMIRKGIMDSDIVRKIKLKDRQNGGDILTITLDKTGIIFLQFLNK